MAVGTPLRRLLRVLNLTEERAQVALEIALGQLRNLENAFDAAVEREHRGRRLLNASAQSEEVVDRHAALEESAAGRRIAALLHSQIAQTEQLATRRREEFFARRVERRQVETLLHESEARAAREEARRSQRLTDDWYLGRLQRGGIDESERENSTSRELE
jgi:hypothetical protein